MEKLDKVIAGLEMCISENICCAGCPYEKFDWCEDQMGKDALAVIEALRAERDDLRKDIEVLTEELRNSEPVVHAHWEFVDFSSPNLQCSACGGLAPMDCCGDYHSERTERCPHCGAHMGEQLELRTCYCPICDKHFEVRSNDSGGSCPDCGRRVVLHRVEVAE